MTYFANETNLAYGNGGYDDHLVSISERPREQGPSLAASPTIQEMIMTMNMGVMAYAVYAAYASGSVIWRKPNTQM